MNREERETYFPDILFSTTQETYQEMMKNKEIRRTIVSFLNNSEQRRRVSCWGRIRWEKTETGEWKAGKEWENVLAEILEMRKFFGENSKIWLTDPGDDREGRDLIVYINKEKDLLLAIDLTLNGDKEVLNKKFIHSHHDNPVELKVPPEPRKNNPKAIKFVLALSKIVGLEIMNRFFQALEKNRGLENLKNDSDFKKDPVILAGLFEFLEQVNGQLEKFSKKPNAVLYKKEINNLRQIISNQKEILERESTPEIEKIKDYLRKTHIGEMVRQIL